MNNEVTVADYVRTALSLQGIEVDEARLASVTQQFVLLTSMANSFLAESLPAELESAPIYRL